MNIPKYSVELLIEEYREYVDRIINHTYFHADCETKKELQQVGLIGLWKGITSYYKKDLREFERKEFVDTICAHIRYEMKDYFLNSRIVKINKKQWRNFNNLKEIISEFPDASNEKLKYLAKRSGLNYEQYIKTKELLDHVSLDAKNSDDSKTNLYNILSTSCKEIKTFLDKEYIIYIINSALAGLKYNTDRELIQIWIKSITDGKEMNRTALCTRFNMSSSKVNAIIYRFIAICRFVRDCELALQSSPYDVIYLPELPGGKKIPGVCFEFCNNKWKSNIVVGRKTMFLGYFDHYWEAVKARRNAELLYRGQSNIVI